MKKSTKILVAAVLVLAAGYLIQRFTSRTSTTARTHLFAGLDTSTINEISLDGRFAIRLKREQGRWMLESPVANPADQGQVEMLLSKISTDPSGFAVASDLSDTAAYGFRSSTLTVKTSGGKVVSLNIGGTTPDFEGCYVQVAGESKVLELSENLRTFVDEPLKDWREKRIFTANLSDLQSVEFEVGDTLYHFVRQDTVWEVNGRQLPSSRITEPTESLVGVEAMDFIDSVVSAANTLVEFEFSESSGRQVSGKIFKVAELDCLSSSATNQVYVVSPTLPENLLRSLRQIRKDYLTRKRE
ncbi:MAG TPA: DUF4340 domain-containing protein [Candidatus Kryptonia bacterium]